MARHRLLPAGEAGRGMAHLRAGRGGGGSPGLHGAKRRKDGETAATAKRRCIAAPTARPLRQGAGTGPNKGQVHGGAAASACGCAIRPLSSRHDEQHRPHLPALGRHLEQSSPVKRARPLAMPKLRHPIAGRSLDPGLQVRSERLPCRPARSLHYGRMPWAGLLHGRAKLWPPVADHVVARRSPGHTDLRCTCGQRRLARTGGRRPHPFLRTPQRPRRRSLAAGASPFCAT